MYITSKNKMIGTVGTEPLTRNEYGSIITDGGLISYTYFVSDTFSGH